MSSETEASTMKQEETAALLPKLRFPEFQNTGEWRVSSIGDLKPFVTSGSRGWAPFYADKGELFVRITNLWRDSIYLDLTDSKFVQLPSGASEGVRTQLKGHDVLISITADIGIIGYVDESVPSPAYINQHIALVRFEKEQLCGKYVAYFLASEKSQRLFRSSTDIGTKAGMSLTGIHKIQLTFPGLPEQQHIAEFLTSVDKLIAEQARKVEALKTHKKALMQQLFPREGETQPRLRFPEFQDAGEWEVVALGDIAEIKLGKMLDKQKHTTGHLLPYLNNLAVRWNQVNTSDLPKMYFNDRELSRFGLRAGDVVVCEGGEPGRAAVWDGRLPDLKFQKAIHRVRFNVPFEPKLLVLYLENLAGTTKFEILFTGGGIKHLTRETFALLEVPLIPYAEQQRIASCLAAPPPAPSLLPTTTSRPSRSSSPRTPAKSPG